MKGRYPPAACRRMSRRLQKVALAAGVRYAYDQYRAVETGRGPSRKTRQAGGHWVFPCEFRVIVRDRVVRHKGVCSRPHAKRHPPASLIAVKDYLTLLVKYCPRGARHDSRGASSQPIGDLS